MKRPTTIALAVWLALCAATPLVSAAAAPGPLSDASLRYSRARTERDIDMLQRDQHDYNGHRAKAITELQEARGQILIALRYDSRHDLKTVSLSLNGAFRGNINSDANLIYVRRDVERSIDLLQRDNHDYGGHRVKAIGELQQARTQIVDALRSDGRH